MSRLADGAWHSQVELLKAKLGNEIKQQSQASQHANRVDAKTWLRQLHKSAAALP